VSVSVALCNSKKTELFIFVPFVVAVRYPTNGQQQTTRLRSSLKNFRGSRSTNPGLNIGKSFMVTSFQEGHLGEQRSKMWPAAMDPMLVGERDPLRTRPFTFSFLPEARLRLRRGYPC
jgi:hypothetical protein